MSQINFLTKETSDVLLSRGRSWCSVRKADVSNHALQNFEHVLSIILEVDWGNTIIVFIIHIAGG